MNSLACLALVVYMESRGEALITQHYVASVAIQRAEQEEVSVCKSMKKPRAYSWLWDGVNTKVDPKQLELSKKVAKQELQKQTLQGRLYFNECRLGKRFRTEHKMIKSGGLCFY